MAVPHRGRRHSQQDETTTRQEAWIRVCLTNDLTFSTTDTTLTSTGKSDEDYMTWHGPRGASAQLDYIVGEVRCCRAWGVGPPAFRSDHCVVWATFDPTLRRAIRASLQKTPQTKTRHSLKGWCPQSAEALAQYRRHTQSLSGSHQRVPESTMRCGRRRRPALREPLGTRLGREKKGGGQEGTRLSARRSLLTSRDKPRNRAHIRKSVGFFVERPAS